MFSLAHAISQSVGGVISMHGYMRLHDGRASIQLLGDEVYGGTVFCVTGVKHPLMGMQSGISG